MPARRIGTLGSSPNFWDRTLAALASLLILGGAPVQGLAQNVPPTEAIDITTEEIEAVLADDGQGTDRQLRIVDMGDYNLAVGVIYRGPTDDEDEGGPVSGIVHSNTTETYVIRSGSGTLVTGGTLTNARDIPAESQVVTILNGPSQFGTVEGGTARVVEPGDVIIVPAGVFHGWTNIEDHVTYLSIRPDPDKVLQAGYVNPAIEQ